MNMKKILLALGIGAGVGAACYFAKKKLDEMYYDMCAAPPYVPSPAGPAKRPAATAEKNPLLMRRPLSLSQRKRALSPLLPTAKT